LYTSKPGFSTGDGLEEAIGQKRSTEN